MFPLLMIVFFLGLMGVAIFAGVRQSKRATENLQQLAGTLGLQFNALPRTFGVFNPGTKATGELRGRHVEVYSFATGSGKSRVQWCAVAAPAPASGALTFHLQRQGFGTKFMEVFGAKEIQVGDPEFDRDWFIQTSQPEYFAAALLPEVREKISELVRELGGHARGMEFKLDQGMVRYAEMGGFSSNDVCKRCAQAVEIVCDLADVAEACAGTKAGA